jgi:predicted transcriptional regulator
MTPATGSLNPAGMDVVVSPELSIWECATRLAQAGAARLPVVQEGKVIGTVSETDLATAFHERGGGE